MQALTSVVHFGDTSPSKADFGQVSTTFQNARQVLSHPQIAGLEVGSKVLVSFFLRYFDKTVTRYTSNFCGVVGSLPSRRPSVPLPLSKPGMGPLRPLQCWLFQE
jgi:hypothetical protein